jgi:hypothetical protein
MPDLTEKARPLYMAIWRDRLEQFPPRPDDAYILKDGADRKWLHELRHDAESVFWLLLWWAVHACSEPALPVRNDFWQDLVAPTGPDYDARDGLLTKVSTRKGWLDPAYAHLETLLKSMVSHLTADLHWVTDKDPKEMREAEYVHEAFQRHIFNFLVTNKEQSFMSQKKAATNRVVAKAAYF